MRLVRVLLFRVLSTRCCPSVLRESRLTGYVNSPNHAEAINSTSWLLTARRITCIFHGSAVCSTISKSGISVFHSKKPQFVIFGGLTGFVSRETSMFPTSWVRKGFQGIICFPSEIDHGRELL